MGSLIGLIDCNKFFVSCERVFDPSLKGIPVGVLSNNDGVIIARSNEMKALGVRMGAPYHEVRALLEENGAVVRSSNFALYGDLSRRIMQILEDTFPTVEVYSVDEAFIEFGHSDVKAAATEAGEIRIKIYDWVGIPVSVGVAKTKTLTKVACEWVKKNDIKDGYCVLVGKEAIEKVLEKLPVGDLWGIGRKTAPFLKSYGIDTGLKFKQANEYWIKKKLSITGLRLQKELHEIRCLELATEDEDKQSILRSRSFGKGITDYDDVAEAVANHAFSAARALREQGSVAGYVGVFIRTNPFACKPQYKGSDTTSFMEPTDVSAKIVKGALEALKRVYKEGYEYKKAGAFLGGIEPKSYAPMDLFRGEVDDEKEERLSEAMDLIREKWGDRGLFLGSMGTRKEWKPQKKNRSPNYVTEWEDLQSVKAKR